jgi:peptidoglycan lytic transglycosylase A
MFPARTNAPVRAIIAAALLLFSLASCVKPPVTIPGPEGALERFSFRRMPALVDDRGFKDLAVAVRRSLDYYQKLPPDAPILFGPDKATALDLFVTLQNFLLIIENTSLTPDQKVRQIGREFLFYRSPGSDNNGGVLFTGYYEPVLSCRTAPDAGFRFPLYRRPDDIIEVDLDLFGDGFPRNKIFGRLENNRVVPYYSREEIDGEKALAGRSLELLWCSDPVDIYLLQVQGSGKADLGDGNIVSVLYDGTNGRPYTSIGKYLIDAGALDGENMSMQAIRAYLAAHPEELNGVLDQNQSYVFFRTGTGPSVGNIGVPLTPGRSIATDSALFPRGALAFISAQKPVIENGVIKRWAPFTRFVLNQDTGGAIRGAGRVDLFCGRGREAELTAGSMRQEGELYFLLRKKQPL